LVNGLIDSASLTQGSIQWAVAVVLFWVSPRWNSNIRLHLLLLPQHPAVVGSPQWCDGWLAEGSTIRFFFCAALCVLAGWLGWIPLQRAA
jgi:hypothetical protein